MAGEPPRWCWREVRTLRWYETHSLLDGRPVVRSVLPELVEKRASLSIGQDTKCKALKEIRMIGLDVEARAWRRLIQGEDPPRIFIWPVPPATRAVKLWAEWDLAGESDDLAEPSEKIIYVAD